MRSPHCTTCKYFKHFTYRSVGINEPSEFWCVLLRPEGNRLVGFTACACYEQKLRYRIMPLSHRIKTFFKNLFLKEKL